MQGTLPFSVPLRQTVTRSGGAEKQGRFNMHHVDGKDSSAGQLASIASSVLAMTLMAGVAYITLSSGVTSAAETTETATAVEKSTTDSTPPPSPRSMSTKHELTLDGKVLSYTATVGWLILKGDKAVERENFYR